MKQVRIKSKEDVWPAFLSLLGGALKE
jgi:hypothetical protein